jgi:hypothetical protein
MYKKCNGSNTLETFIIFITNLLLFLQGMNGSVVVVLLILLLQVAQQYTPRNTASFTEQIPTTTSLYSFDETYGLLFDGDALM